MTYSKEDMFVNNIMQVTKQAVFDALKTKYGTFTPHQDTIGEEDANNIIIAFCAAAAQLAIHFQKDQDEFKNVAIACFKDVIGTNDYSNLLLN